MDRRIFLTALAGLLAAPLDADTQQAGKVYRIGWLGSVPPTTPEISRSWEAFLNGLRELGYVEGKNILIERRFHQGHFTRLPQLAAELVALKVDLIVATTAPETRAAKQATAKAGKARSSGAADKRSAAKSTKSPKRTRR